VKGLEQAAYRFRVAEGFLLEARQDVGLGRWRAVMDNAQLSVENAAKAVLALLGPVGRTHQPAIFLRQALQSSLHTGFPSAKVERLAELAEMLGADIHIQTDYGDETRGRTPWELFGQTDAEMALVIAEEALILSGEIIQAVQSERNEGTHSES
jgi:HEPN domain-containing protein